MHYELFIIILLMIILIIIRKKRIQEDLSISTRPPGDLSCDNLNTSWEDKQNWEKVEIPDVKNMINEKDKQNYYELLGDIHEIMNKNNLKYSLSAGTLLGSYRHGDIIPYDDDADICIKYEDHDKLFSLEKEFKKKNIRLNNGCLACWSEYYKDVCNYINDRSKIDKNYGKTDMKKCKSTKYFSSLNRNGLHVDVFHVIPIIDKNNNKMYTVYGGNNLLTQEEYENMFDTVECPFGNKMLNCSNNTKSLLCKEYRDLSIPDKNQMENKSLNPNMWRTKEKNTPHFVKEGDSYIFKT